MSSKWEVSRTTAEEFVERYGPDVHRAARLYTGDSALAEDVAQEVLIAAVHALHLIREPSRWLARVTHNKALNALRAQGRRHEVPLIEWCDSPVDDPADLYEERDVVEAVQELAIPLREVVVLHYYEGWTPKQIGHLLGLPAGTVRSRLHRARGALRSMLAGGEKE